MRNRTILQNYVNVKLNMVYPQNSGILLKLFDVITLFRNYRCL